MAVKPQTSQDVHAPFNFVPLSEHVFFPDWADQVSQDIPFKDGYCGEIEIELEAKSKLLIGGGSGTEQDKDRNKSRLVTFVKDPSGNYIVPGSSLKGMIRNVLEIASFGKMLGIDDHRFAVRDLQNRGLYTSKMVKTISHKDRVFGAKPKTGWLYIKDNNWFIQPCDYYRIDRGDLAEELDYGIAQERHNLLRDIKKLSSELQDVNKKTEKMRWEDIERALNRKLKDLRFLQNGKLIHEYRPGTIYSIEDIYAGVQNLVESDGSIRVEAIERFDDYLPRQNISVANEMCEISSTGDVGYLVMTGMSATKDREFVFLPGNKSAAMPVPRETIELFQQIMTDIAHPQERIKALEVDRQDSTWGYWWRKLSDGDVGPESNGMPGIPVFYLTAENGKIRSLGLSQMHKLPYDLSLHEMLANASEDHLSSKPDLADLLFGKVDEVVGNASFASRVSFGHGRAVNEVAPIDTFKTAILSSPKPTYYPIYVEQASSTQGEVSGEYQTYMSDGGTPKLRGWKRYIPRSEADDSKGQGAVTTRLKPLKEGARFRFRVQFHNLREEELGALLWALFLGGQQAETPSGHVHSLGIGKGIGFGQVALNAVSMKFRKNGTREFELQNLNLAIAQYIKKFEKLMNSFVPGGTQNAWEKSDQVLSLLAMSEVDAGKNLGLVLDYMEIEHKRERGRPVNQYTEAKKSKNRKALPKIAERL